MAHAVVNSAPQSSRRATKDTSKSQRDRKSKPDKKENCEAVAQLLRKTERADEVPKKPTENKPQVQQVKKEEQRQVLAPANIKQPKEPAPE